MNKLKIAVIGTGLVGSFHAETFFRNPNSELIAVCDIDKEKVKKIANKFKCKAYNEFESLINTEKLDAISIATPEQIRIAPALLAIERGLKILLEKPLGRNLEDIENLVNKIKNHNKLISVNFILHEDPRYKLMKEKIKNNEIGEIVSCYARRRGNRFGIEIYAPWTDLISSTLIHDIQMVMSINNSKPERIYAEAVIRECAKFNSHDAVMSIIKFTDGSIASFETSWVLPKNQPEFLDPAFHVVGDKGSIIIEGSSMGLQIQTDKSYMKPDLSNWPIIDSKVEGCLKRNLDKFIEDCVYDNQPDVDLIKAYEVEKIVFAMKKSIDENRLINL
ncbi:MAG: scyllo-inositol 2-dehydrogenase (NAD(+)) [Alphaproteobacteria bacterium MarineAlpha5_Bin5]|nr:MAG: scyllo-inositol 2-dehydrogenase (NAD(+)) [Alphaproteobacteria bacterium MarineAlpha5_Bin5]PPR52670.1 MAG: scyllo-inositol 2-dehydrogenase (NAD(+)) [Alphaproteobacteria bacterium MarineAlpha5_Bin4]